jgi:hypothetical protein
MPMRGLHVEGLSTFAGEGGIGRRVCRSDREQIECERSFGFTTETQSYTEKCGELQDGRHARKSQAALPETYYGTHLTRYYRVDKLAD